MAEIGKAMTFVQGLLPAIYAFTVLGGQNNTMDTAIESAKRAELAVIGQLQPIVMPQRMENNIYQELQIGKTNRILQDIKKEKTEDDMDDLVKQMKELKTYMIETQKGNNERNNYNRNTRGNRDYDVQNITCWTCGEKGHYANRCGNNNAIPFPTRD